MEIQNRRVAILATHGFEESELISPREALKKAGAEVEVVSPENHSIKAWKDKDWGRTVEVDRNLSKASVDEYDALVLPGGLINPDSLRMNGEAVAFVRDFMKSGKPVAAICHGPWMLVEADAVKGRKVTSYPSLKTDLINAGAEWVDQEVVDDQGLVTSRNPKDLPAFIEKLIEEIKEGRHPRSSAA